MLEKKVFIDFILWDTKIPPKEITKELNVVPDTELLQGERFPERNVPRKNIWSIESTIISNSIDAHWQELKEKLSTKRDKIKEISKDCDAKIVVIIDSEGTIPKNLIIPPDMSEFVSYIGAIIDIDHMQ